MQQLDDWMRHLLILVVLVTLAGGWKIAYYSGVACLLEKGEHENSVNFFLLHFPRWKNFKILSQG